MKQLLFDFFEEDESQSDIPLEPHVRKELVALMAAAIVAAHRKEGTHTDDSTPQREQDHS